MTPHGELRTYKYHGCRCDECRAANAAYHTAYRRSLGVRPADEVRAEATHHGWSRYKKGGCRCDVCRAAAAAQKRRQRANNAEHYAEKERQRYQRAKRAAAGELLEAAKGMASR